MKILIDNSINFLGTIYQPVDKCVEQKSGSRRREITYLYIIRNPEDNEDYSVFVTHSSDHIDLFMLNVIKGIRTISQYMNDNIDKRYAGAFAIELKNLDSEIERLVVEHLRYSDLVAYVKKNFPGTLNI